MNSQELLQEVRRLKVIKKKNEEAVSPELLQTKYQKSYEKLCGSLKETESELRAKYMQILRLIGEVMAASVYAQPDGEDEWLDQELNRIYKESEKDPLLKVFCQAFWEFGEKKC